MPGKAAGLTLGDCLIPGMGNEPALGIPLLGTVVSGKPIPGRKKGAPSKPKGRRAKPKQPKQATEGKAVQQASTMRYITQAHIVFSAC